MAGCWVTRMVPAELRLLPSTGKVSTLLTSVRRTSLNICLNRFVLVVVSVVLDDELDALDESEALDASDAAGVSDASTPVLASVVVVPVPDELQPLMSSIETANKVMEIREI